jgi:hypothetical protein
MNRMLHDTVAAIANGTRTWVEAKAFRSDYNPDDLQGWCAIASAELQRRLNIEGIEAKIHMWVSSWQECHCFVVVEDHVIDVTATQFKEFRNQPVLIMHIKEAEVYEMYSTSEVFSTASELRRYQKRERWPSNQIAYA